MKRKKNTGNIMTRMQLNCFRESLRIYTHVYVRTSLIINIPFWEIIDKVIQTYEDIYVDLFFL